MVVFLKYKNKLFENFDTNVATASGSMSQTSIATALVSSQGSANVSSQGSANVSSQGSANVSSQGSANVSSQGSSDLAQSSGSIFNVALSTPVAQALQISSTGIDQILNSSVSSIDSSSLSQYTTPPPITKLINVATNQPNILAPKEPLTIIQQNNIKLYLNAFNIQISDPRNIITISYSFDSSNIPDLQTLEFTRIEQTLANILNLDENSVIANSINFDVNNNAIVTFAITYPSLSQSNAAITNIDNIIQIPQNIATIFSILNGITFFKLVGKPIQGKAITINNSYMCAPNSWCDYNNPNIKYNIKGNNIPSNINSVDGLGLLNIQLYGPPSNTLGLSTNNYVLESFTIAFYMKINSLIFNDNNSIIWYQMYAETPNMIRFAIYQQDSNYSIVEAIIGNQNINYRWIIPNTTLMSNGNITMYTFIYNKPQSILYFYIGSTVNTATIEMNTDAPIVLSLTPIAINKGSQTFDAQLYAFIYYNSILSIAEIKQLSEYFNYEYGGLGALTQSNSQVLQKLETLTTELTAVQGSQNAIQNQLNQCLNANASGSVIKHKQPYNPGPSPWNVNYNKQVDPLMESEINQCSPLKLKELNLANGSLIGTKSNPSLKYKPISINNK